MKIDPIRFSIATAVAVGVIWAICSAFVFGTPDMAMYTAGGMMHGDTTMMTMQVTPSGFIVGLFAWSLGAGFTAGLVAVVYNALSGQSVTMNN